MDTWTQTQGLSDRQVGFRAGYEVGFSKAWQGLVLTIPGGWRRPPEQGLPGGEWQTGWRQGWVAGCEDGWAARKGEERLGEDC